MTSYSLSLPNDLLEEIRQLAAENDVSLDNWLVAAISEKVEVAKTQRLLQQYAARADETKLARILAKVPDSEPLPGDEL